MVSRKMVRMKKILSLIAVISILCCFAACGKTSENDDNTDSVRDIVSSEENTSHDDSAAVTTCEFSNIAIDIPKGFVALNDSETFTNYVTGNYPDERDSISLSKSVETADDYSEENLNMLMQQLNERAERSIYSDDGCIDYKQYTIDGHDAVSYKSEITADNALSIQTQVAVFFDDGAVIISFSSLSGDYDEEFEKTVESIRVIE